jgi:hypothetical protein
MKRKINISPTIEFILGPTPAVSSRNAAAFEVMFEQLAAHFEPRDVIEWWFVRDAAYYGCQTRCWRELTAAIIINAKKKPAMSKSASPQPGSEKMAQEMRASLEAAEVFLDWIGPYERAQDCQQMMERRFFEVLRQFCEYRQAGGMRDVLLAPQNKTIAGFLAAELVPEAIEDGTTAQTSAESLDSTESVPAGTEGVEHADKEQSG